MKKKGLVKIWKSKVGIIALFIVIMLFVIWIYPKAVRFVKIDDCLDKGGRWNNETEECEF